MTQATDGKVYVFAVFDDDGYECSDLVGVFSSNEKAEECAVELRVKARREWEERVGRYGGNHADSRNITVEILALDERRFEI